MRGMGSKSIKEPLKRKPQRPGLRTSLHQASGPHSKLQHSPSSRAEAKLVAEVLDFGRGKSLRHRVGNHVVGRAIDKADRAVVNDPANEVEANIDMLRTSVVLMILCQRDR